MEPKPWWLSGQFLDLRTAPQKIREPVLMNNHHFKNKIKSMDSQRPTILCSFFHGICSLFKITNIASSLILVFILFYFSKSAIGRSSVPIFSKTETRVYYENEMPNTTHPKTFHPKEKLVVKFYTSTMP
jgi:hypothetical protein